MCYFVFVSVPSSKVIAVENSATTGLSVHPISSPVVDALFPQGHVVFEVTDGACSCSLYPSNTRHRDEAKRRAKYKQKGWSASKIERALNSKRQHDSKKRDIGRTFETFLDNIVATAGEIGLFVHWFKGSTVGESLNSLHTIKRYVGEGWDYPPDTLILIRAGDD